MASSGRDPILTSGNEARKHILRWPLEMLLEKCPGTVGMALREALGNCDASVSSDLSPRGLGNLCWTSCVGNLGHAIEEWRTEHLAHEHLAHSSIPPRHVELACVGDLSRGHFSCTRH